MIIHAHNPEHNSLLLFDLFCKFILMEVLDSYTLTEEKDQRPPQENRDMLNVREALPPPWNSLQELELLSAMHPKSLIAIVC